MKTKILYVEDEPFLGRIVKESLESRELEVNMVTDGLAVLPELEQFLPDLCVLDVMLPNLDGFSVAREIRQRHPHLPILFLTAKTQVEDVVQGFGVGGNDYLRKPFSMEELIVRIDNLLRMKLNSPFSTPKSTQAIPLGNYEFWPQKFELRLHEHIRKLSHRENELLKILSENRHQTIARKEILMRVWGDDSFFNSRNLDVYITRLREYLREDQQLQLVTIKGVGYHFITD
ncbi:MULTISPECIES: response regulator transcription factor [unclassified Siphonobacter]|uniref:response regulator transcription factor n=1 Tax=unclassified Siphonobacter TaxID=2635712 RepID=UPI000CC52488|nr:MULTISPECIES: response regulator transcription factor [unclassified Siphonobacter]MDQ1088850.1 two-component system response regulator VicR [Siphonobacter sp. SORGH_AS_1065]MDR6195036.1 two-component system response regulator VicR [Siphonobacter sp. SORGH_AS_0500]PKK38426.1 DNA-binding response regulator [Siphonobacter sp. SORGH_AS_0500]